MPIRRSDYIIGTSAEWAERNGVLGDGQLGVDSTVNRIKMGDGITPWNLLGWDSGDAADIARASGLLPIGVGTGIYALTANATVGTGRLPFLITRGVTDLAVAFTNFSTAAGGVDTDGPGDLVLSCSVEIAGNIYRLTFSGNVQATIKAGSHVVSDTLPVDLPAGTTVYFRTFIASGTWYTRSTAQVAGMGGWTVTTDLTAPGSAAIADVTSYAAIPGPSLVLGRPSTADRRALLQVGDSIGFGQGDSIVPSQAYNTLTPKLGRAGWIGRIATAAGVGVVNIASPGDQGNNFATLANRLRRLAFARYGSTAIVNYGRNDISAARTLAQVQASTLSNAILFANRFLKVLQPTVTPLTTTADGWRTQGAQTLVASEPVRVAFNAWLRDGAPIVNGSPVAVGTAGAVRAAVYDGTGTLVSAAPVDVGPHPIWAVVDPAANVENGGKWLSPLNLRNVGDAVTTAAGSVVTSATAAFTSADIGRHVTIAGAGTAGGLYVGLIKNVNSATQITLAAPTPTAVSAAAIYIGDFFTIDGTHPSAAAYDAMATAVPSSLIS